MNYNEFTQKLKEWSSTPNYYRNFILISNDGKKTKARLFYSHNYGLPCKYRKGSRSYGSPIPEHEIAQVADFYPEAKAIDLVQKLQRTCKRAVELMTVSGLWPDHCRCFKAIAEASYEDAKRFLYCDREDINYYDDNLRDAWMQSHGVDANHISYDEMCGLINKGIVNIPYNKWERDSIKQQALEAIRDDKSFNHHWRGSYDYSISIEKQSDGKKRAWYSAEFKNCGNGHYYLMIDESHAFHCEDD